MPLTPAERAKRYREKNKDKSENEKIFVRGISE